MIREVILDTETTGLDPAKGDRIVEIGALELLNHIPTGKTYHTYINPERDVPKEAEAVHGLSTAFLRDKPAFPLIVDAFLSFIADSVLVIHNASFDVGFLNAELSFVKRTLIGPERVVDTLLIARQKHPGAANSLDALCRRYGIDNTRRTKHGALLDSELLAEVYIELTGGRQAALLLEATTRTIKPVFQAKSGTLVRPSALPTRLTGEEKLAHRLFVESLGEQALWKQSPG